MERGALSTAEFREFAKDYILFCHITSRVEGEKYPNLLQEKGGRGFPHIIAMNAEGKALETLKGPRTTEGFSTFMTNVSDFQVLSAKSELTASEQVRLYMAKLGLGKLDFEQAKAEAAKLTDVSDEDQAKVDDALLGMEIMSLAPPRTGGPEAAAAAGKAYAEMMANGREPKEGETQTFQLFYILIMEHALQSKDVALFEKGLAKMKTVFGENPKAVGFFKAKEKQLAELKASSEAGD